FSILPLHPFPSVYIHTFCPFLFFFFNDPAPTQFYTLSLHDALPISIPFAIPLTITHLFFTNGLTMYLILSFASPDGFLVPITLRVGERCNNSVFPIAYNTKGGSLIVFNMDG